MVKQIFTLYDSATRTYSEPVLARSRDEAERIVRGSLSPQSQLVLYPSDYKLFFNGSYDDATGLFSCDGVQEVELLTRMIPLGLRKYALDGSFGGETHEAQKD